MTQRAQGGRWKSTSKACSRTSRLPDISIRSTSKSDPRVQKVHKTINNTRRNTMKRRDFIKLSAGLGATMATTAPLSSAFAQTKMVLKASDVHPLGYPTVEAVVRMGKKLEAASNGRLTVQMFPSMQLGGEKEMIEQAQLGALQIA